MSATAFQRRRRELARQLAEREANTLADETNVTDGQNEAQTELVDEELGKPLATDEIENIEQVKALLDELGIKYAHNTGEAKLREKLKDAIG